MMEFFFDTETTGLPKRKGNKFDSYKNVESYDSSRIVSISWIVTQKQKVVAQGYYVVKPDGFHIPPEATAIHKISNEEAHSTGVPITVVFDYLREYLPFCSHMVAHNIDFDINILNSELYRYEQMDLIEHIQKMHMVCTMKKGKDFLKRKTYPKLQLLAKELLDVDITDMAHNAQVDTYYCYQCYTKMFPVDNSIFFFGNRGVKLTDAQKDIVYLEHDKNTLVIACAGAGKTLTVLCRIKHLLESGVPEASIMMTTFTRDAANDMKNKLFDIMGYAPSITVGTIDSIARRYCSKKDGIKHVDEFGHEFLKLITAFPDTIKQYKYMFVDEFQDINDVQFGIIEQFYKNGCKIFAVGDDAQNIYTFRGSKIEFILKFADHFGNSVCKYLIENFRSTREIIDMANASIEKNENSIPKKMIAASGENGEKPLVRYFVSSNTQNITIVDEIKELLDSGVAHHDIAVLSPVNQSLYMIEELLTQRAISNVYLDGKCDVKTTKKPWHVCLSTIHKSKGLEWEHVLIINVSDEIIPKTKSSLASIEESRRLFYVAVTRARKQLKLYYTVMIAQQPYVSRYISELDKCLYDTKDMMGECFGQSDLDLVPIEMSVTRLIENLNGADYIKLKELGVIPKVDKKDFVTTKLYESCTYVKVIENNDLYSDFGIFIEKYIKRELAGHFGNAELCKDKHVIMCLANLKLDPQSFMIYQQYKVNFKNNLRKLKPYLFNVWGNSGKIKVTLEQNGKFIQESHMRTLIMVLINIKQKADQYGIEPHEVPVFSRSFLPQGFEKSMEKSFMTFKDITAPPDVKEIWDVSKCKKIVTEYRRRLLFKNIDAVTDFAEYEGLFRNISRSGKLVEHVISMYNKEIATDETFEAKEGVFGEVDLRVDDIIVDYKTSINDDVSMQWLVQLLCYKALAEFNGKKINKVGILNALRGWYSEIDVSSWDKHHELIAYLLMRRNSAQK